MSIDPGWYPAEGDPPNTVRYWDGRQWQGGPQATPAQGPGPLSQNPGQQGPGQQGPGQQSTGPQQFGGDTYAPTPADQYSEPQTPPPAWDQTPAQSFSPGGPSANAGVQPGWYPADGDPPNTVRYWNGSEWQGGPTFAGTGYAAGAAPAPSLGPFEYVKRAVTERYFDFNGRARRAEFGWFVLITWITGLVLASIFGRIGASGIIAVFWLAAIIPYLAVAVRRLHDMSLSGWTIIVMIIPLVNFIFFLVMLFSDSSRGPNNWGRSPKYG